MAEGEQDYRINALRAAGYEDAARLLEVLPSGSQPTAQEAQPAQEAQRQMTPGEAAEAQRRAEGQALLDRMRQQLGGKWSEQEGVTG